MKINKNIFKNIFTIEYGILACLGILAVLLYLPSLRLGFSMVDDWQILVKADSLLQYLRSSEFGKIIGILFEPEHGRVRPAYWIIQSLIAQASLFNPLLMRLFRIALLSGTIFVIYKILKQLHIPSLLIYFSVFLILIDSVIFENYYRLGPAEPFGIFLYFSTLCLLLTKSVKKYHLFLLLLLTTLGVFTKENYFLLAIPLIVYSLATKFLVIKNPFMLKSAIKISILMIILGITVFIIRSLYPSHQEMYTSSYQLDIQQHLLTFTGYLHMLLKFHFPFIYVLISYVILRFYKGWSSPIFMIILLFLFQAVIQLAFLLPWKFVLPRYLIFVNFNLIICYTLMFYEIYTLPNTKKLVKKYSINIYRYAGLAFAISIIMFIRNIFPNANLQLWQETDSVVTQSILDGLSNLVPSNAVVLTNYEKGDSNIELFTAIDSQLALMYSREDIQFEYLDESNLCSDDSTRYILDRRSERFISNEVLDTSSALSLIAAGEQFYKPLNYGEVRNSFLTGKKSEDWSTEHKFDWRIYEQKPNTCIDQ